eukprot:37290_1
MRLAGVEGGGTTWRVAIAKGHPTNVVESETFYTSEDADVTLKMVKNWLDEREFDALGICTFGPIDPRPHSDKYGWITTSPKPGWSDVDVISALSDGTVPVAFDTDVNAPALAEYRWNARPFENSCAYITVGTGVGVGLVINGSTVHGLLHPEAGHLCLQRYPGDESFKGVDKLFGASIEGLVSTPALAARKGCSRDELPDLSDHDPIWEPTAHALATLCASLILVVSPERIVLSGGVMKRTILYDKVRHHTQKLLHGYINLPSITTNAINDYIVPDGFEGKAGTIGALTLAQDALERNDKAGGVNEERRPYRFEDLGILLVCTAAAGVGAAFIGCILNRLQR